MLKRVFSQSWDDFAVLRRLVAENFINYAWHYALAMGLMLLVAGATGFSAWIMRDLINDVFIARNETLLLTICVSVIAIYLVKGVASYGQEVILARIGNQIIAQMQTRLYHSILKQDMAFFQEMASSDLITRITHNARAASAALNLIATSLGRDLFTVISLLVVMLAQDSMLTAIALIGVPFLVSVITRLLARMRKLFGREVETLAEILAAMQETLHGIRVIRSFGLENMMKQRMSAAVERVRKLSNRMASVQAITLPLLDTLGGVAVASVIFYGGWRVIHQGATPGEFFAFVTALLMLTEPARRLARLHLQLAGAAVGVKMLYELIDRAPVTPSLPQVPVRLGKGTISFSHITFGYRAEDPVLRDITLTAEGGHVTALVGASGSGKSSLLNLCLRFWLPQSGEIRIDDQPLSGIDLSSLHEVVSFVSQDVFLFDGTIAENILMGRPTATQEEVEVAARDAAAHDFIMSLPDAYQTSVGEFGGRLSGGQKQRIAIARAFLKNAPILLLDEPTSALDAESDALIQDALSRLMKGRTVLMIAHRLASVIHADKIYVLDGGALVEEGTHQALLTRGGKYARLYELQFHA
ncbi:MAG: ABC transporter ATP-binding protein/permease [Hyphomicrobiales bacterium]|nr:ABC transporter ATP-binding protein/permease [Hyphomicrobiales bacterium]